MNSTEAIKTLSDLRENQEKDLSLDEWYAIGIAVVVLVSLNPTERLVIDALLSVPDVLSN